MNTILLAIGMLLITLGALPYIRDVQRRVVRPRLVSWGIWSVLLVIMTVAAQQAGETTSAVLSGVGAVECALIVVVGWRVGNRSFKLLDWVSVLGAVLGLLSAVATRDPWVTLIIMVVIDAIAYMPTWHHAWQAPEEESLLSFGLNTIGGWLCVASALGTGATFVGLLYPLYSAVAASFMAMLIAYGRWFPSDDNYDYSLGE